MMRSQAESQGWARNQLPCKTHMPSEHCSSSGAERQGCCGDGPRPVGEKRGSRELNCAHAEPRKAQDGITRRVLEKGQGWHLCSHGGVCAPQ